VTRPTGPTTVAGRTSLAGQLAGRALHAPQAGFGDVKFHPVVYDKAAVLVYRLVWNHSLPDGNRQTAWAALVMLIDLNRGTWDPDPPQIDQAEEACRPSPPAMSPRPGPRHSSENAISSST